MSSLIKYPEQLKKPQLSSYSLSKNSNLLRTEMESGATRVRKRFNAVNSIMNATWVLSNSQAVIFEGWIEHALNQAVDWFLMDVKTPQGLLEHQVRFIENPLENQAIHNIGWEYSANIEIKKREVVSEENTVTTLLKPTTLFEFVTGISDALDTYQG